MSLEKILYPGKHGPYNKREYLHHCWRFGNYPSLLEASTLWSLRVGVGISYYLACTDEILEDKVHLARLPPVTPLWAYPALSVISIFCSFVCIVLCHSLFTDECILLMNVDFFSLNFGFYEWIYNIPYNSFCRHVSRKEIARLEANTVFNIIRNNPVPL